MKAKPITMWAAIENKTGRILMNSIGDTEEDAVMNFEICYDIRQLEFCRFARVTVAEVE